MLSAFRTCFFRIIHTIITTMTTSNSGAFSSLRIGNHQNNQLSINSMPASVASAASAGSSMPRERSITPRHVFTSLDQAHKAITKATKQPAHSINSGAQSGSIPCESSAGSSVNAVYAKSTTDTDEHPTTESHRCPRHDGFSRGRRISPTYFRRRSSSLPSVSIRAPHYPGWDEMTPAARAHLHAETIDGYTPDNSLDTPRETGSTVENIVDQYLPSTTIDSRPSTDGQQNHPTNNATVHYTLDNGETIDPPQTRENTTSVPFGRTSKLFRSHGPPPRVPQPPIPEVHPSTVPPPSVIRTVLPVDHTNIPEGHLNISREHSWSTMSTTSSGDIEDLLDIADQTNVVTSAGYNKGNRHLETNHQESINNNVARESVAAIEALPRAVFSTGGVTTDSDEDPFKYDRGSYTVFLQPAREREVSEALHRVSGASTPRTNESNHNGDASTTRGPVGSAAPSMPPPNGLSYQTTARRDINIPNKSAMKKLDLRSYNPKHLQWDEDDEDFDNEFDDLDAAKTDRGDWETVAKTDGGDWETVGSNLGFAKTDRGDWETVAKTDGGDWETVGSSIGQFDSYRAYASGTGFGSRFGLGTTGSSIADVSETSSMRAGSFGAFASTEKIVQHPMKGRYGNYLLRLNKGDNRPVFLPQPRIHRVNGYAQDSCRLFDQATTSSSQGSSTRAYLAEKLRAPFRSLSSSRNTDRRHPYGSSQSGPDSGHQLRHHGLRRLAPQTPGAEDSFQANTSIGPESPVQFSFPLIPLEEAARLQAMKRRSDANERSFQTSPPARKNSLVSCLSWKATNRLTKKSAPSTPHTLPRKPLPTHCREPVSNHRVSIRMYDPNSTTSVRYANSFAENRVAINGRETTGLSTLSSASPPAPGRPVFPRSCRNPFSSAHGSDRSSSDYRRSWANPFERPHLWSKDRRTSRVDCEGSYLHQLANLNVTDPFRLDEEEGYLSWEARRRRKQFVWFLFVLCVFPFMAPLVYKGTFDATLAWFTKGEVDCLNYRQRRKVLIFGSVITLLWLCGIAILTTLLATRAKNGHS